MESIDSDLVSGATQATAGLAAVEFMERSIQRLICRCDGASRELSAAAQSLIDAATSSLAASKATSRSLQRYRSLWFDKHMEELDAGVKLLAAAARIPVGGGMEDAELATSLEALLPLTSSSFAPNNSSYIYYPAAGLSSLALALEAATRLQLGVSAVTSVLSGPGLRWFKSGLTSDAASHNVIRVDARDALGEGLRSLSVEDVDLRVTGTGASLSSVSLVVPSTLELIYQVNGAAAPGATEVTISVTVGDEVFPPIRVSEGRLVEGNVVAAYNIPGVTSGVTARSNSRLGLALSPDETVAVISNKTKCLLEVYAFPSFSLLRTIGSAGRGPAQFKAPYKVCFSSNTNILVADSDNDRVQEIAVGTGDHIRDIGVGTLSSPKSIALNRSCSTLAVSARSASGGGTAIHLFDLASGRVIRTLCDSRISSALWTCFTPDGARIVTRGRTSPILFYSLNGVYMGDSGSIQTSIPTPTDVAFATNGEILVAENANRLFILKNEGDTILRVINFNEGLVEISADSVRYPMSLAMCTDGSVLLLSQFGSDVVAIA